MSCFEAIQNYYLKNYNIEIRRLDARGADKKEDGKEQSRNQHYLHSKTSKYEQEPIKIPSCRKGSNKN